MDSGPKACVLPCGAPTSWAPTPALTWGGLLAPLFKDQKVLPRAEVLSL